MGEKYADGMNMLDILKKLQEAPTLRDAEKLVKESYPTWIVGYYDRYSEDYPSLTRNWYDICTAAGVSPAQILVVDYMSFSDDHTIIRRFGDVFTSAGFTVRRKADLIPCEGCRSMIPVRALYELLRKKGETIPDVWSPLCNGCVVPTEGEEEGEGEGEEEEEGEDAPILD